LEAADDVGDVGQSEVLEARCGQRGGVALVADDDPRDMPIDRLRDAGSAGGVQPPLQVIALDEESARDLAVRPTLALGPGVDETGARPA